MSVNALDKELLKIQKKEDKFFEDNAEVKSSKINDFIEEKIPSGVKSTLDKAFLKAFETVFEKGTSVIEKGYDKEELKLDYQLKEYAFKLKGDKKRTRAFTKKEAGTRRKNVAISGVKGTVFGLLGIGIPDIPVFVGVLLKGCYEIALQYGYEYEGKAEKYFILSLIEASMLRGMPASMVDGGINKFIASGVLPEGYSLEAHIKKVADILSTELLTVKFIQGLPLVGAAGGIYDTVVTNKVLQYAGLKYRRRRFTEMKKGEL